MIAFLTALALFAFDPAADAAALDRPEARTETLRRLGRLGRLDLDAARAAQLGPRLAALAADPTVPFADRVLAIRAASILRGEGVAAQLAPIITAVADPAANAEATALAREAARALLQLRAADALVAALDAPDPEVRALAARSGAGGIRLCAMLADDPWEDVRIAAAHGLAMHPESADCLAPALASVDPKLRLAAVRAASMARRPALKAPLRALAGDAKAPVDARAEAFVALGYLGDTEPAEKALAVHLAGGGIEPLAEASVRALAAAGAPPARIREALASEAPVVQLAAVRALVALGDRESLPALRALRDRFDPRRRRTLDELIERLDAPALGEERDAAGMSETL